MKAKKPVKLADRLKSQTSLNDSKLQGLYKQYVKLLCASFLRCIERDAKPDVRKLEIDLEFLRSNGNVFSFSETGSFIAGKAIDLVIDKHDLSKINRSLVNSDRGRLRMKIESGNHYPILESLKNKALGLEAYLTDHKTQIMSDVTKCIQDEGFTVSMSIKPNRNHQYDNGIQSYYLSAKVSW